MKSFYHLFRIICYALMVVSCEKDVLVKGSVESLPPTKLVVTQDQQRAIAAYNSFSIGNYLSHTRFCTELLTLPSGKQETRYRDINNQVSFPLNLQMIYCITANGGWNSLNTSQQKTFLYSLGYDGHDLNQINSFFETLLPQLSTIDPTIDLRISNALFDNTLTEVSFPSDVFETISEKYKLYYSLSEYADSYPLSYPNPGHERPDYKWIQETTNCLISNYPTLWNDFSVVSNLLFQGKWGVSFTEGYNKSANILVFGENDYSSNNVVFSTGMFLAHEEDEFYSVNLPLGSGAFHLTLLKPKKGFKCSDVKNLLSFDKWEEIRNDLHRAKLTIGIPEFTIRDDFASFGVDFEAALPTGAWGNRQPFLLTVDRKGIQAACSSSIIFNPSGIGYEEYRKEPVPEEASMIYILSEAGSGLILFLGAYAGL